MTYNQRDDLPPTDSRRKSHNHSTKSNKSILQSHPKYQARIIPVMRADAEIRDDQPQQDRSFTTGSNTTYTTASVDRLFDDFPLINNSSSSNSTTSNNDNNINNNNNIDDDDAIPDIYAETIIRGFGRHADLYRDVLQVSPDASPRQLRICYFRRSREVLNEGGIRSFEGGTPSSGSDLPEPVRIRFQAVNMAYEIVTHPVWKQRHLEEGLRCSGWTDIPPSASAHPVARIPSTQSVSSRHSVRWNEQVEELIYDREPEEQIPLDVMKRKSRKKGKRSKTKIFFEEETELDEHLAKLDAEAEPHFVSDFFDNLEESLDGLLKFGGDAGEDNHQQSSKTGSKGEANKDKANKEKSLKNKQAKGSTSSLPGGNSDGGSSSAGFGGFMERVTSYDDDSIVGRLTNQILGRSMSMDEPSESRNEKGQDSSQAMDLLPLSSWDEKRNIPYQRSMSVDDPLESRSEKEKDSSQSKHLLPLSSSEENQRSPFRCVSPDPCREDEYAADDEPFDFGSMTFSPSGSVSSTPRELRATTSEDIFDGIEDELINQPSTIILRLHNRPTSPGNISTVSDLSESVANRDQASTPNSFLISPDTSFSAERSQATASSQPVTPTFPEGLLNETDEDSFDDTWCNSAEIMQAFPFLAAQDQPKATLEEDPGGKVPVDTKLQPNEEDGFLQFLANYILAMAQQLHSMGKIDSEVDWKEAVLGACMLQDDEVDYLMTIVAAELEKTPSMHSADTMVAPTPLAIEAVNSFS